MYVHMYIFCTALLCQQLIETLFVYLFPANCSADHWKTLYVRVRERVCGQVRLPHEAIRRNTKIAYKCQLTNIFAEEKPKHNKNLTSSAAEGAR